MTLPKGYGSDGRKKIKIEDQWTRQREQERQEERRRRRQTKILTVGSIAAGVIIFWILVNYIGSLPPPPVKTPEQRAAEVEQSFVLFDGERLKIIKYDAYSSSSQKNTFQLMEKYEAEGYRVADIFFRGDDGDYQYVIMEKVE